MTNLFAEFKLGITKDLNFNRAWPLYGAGFENLGKEGELINIQIVKCGPDELIIRHDACSLCFSDIKVIMAGQDHPRIYRDMKVEPVVLGHEVALTVIAVGQNLREQFSQGDRFIIQAEIYVDGINYAYGYELQGGLSEFNKIDMRIIDGDDGSYLIPVDKQTGYAESALTEPWACVNAAYSLNYRNAPKNGGSIWFIGPEPEDPVSLEDVINLNSHPNKMTLTQMEGSMGKWLREKAKMLNINVTEMDKISQNPDQRRNQSYDDIILFDPSPDKINIVSQYLSWYGIMVLVSDFRTPMLSKLDVGRIHYNRWLFIGGDNKKVSEIYQRHPIINSEIPVDGRVFFVGAGGPMGRMHVQRALENNNKPSLIICSDVSDERLEQLKTSFEPDAQKYGIHMIFVNPTKKQEYIERLSSFLQDGFDYIVILAPIANLITENIKYLAKRGVMNIFAGIPRGNYAELDFSEIINKDIRLIGHSASSIDDMISVLKQVENKKLSTNRSVAAIGSMEAVPEGLKAVKEARLPGKIVIYPHIKPLPLTPLEDLQLILPEVYEKLRNGKEWTNEAEEELLNLMLK